MFFVIVLFVLILIFAAVLMYFFNLAFIGHNIGDLDDINSPLNKPLWKYKDIIGPCIEQLNKTSYERVYTQSFDRLRLSARYFDNSCKKTIILFHGYRASAARDYACALKEYFDLGFNVLLVDQRSHGESEGRLITFGVKESRDVLSWINFATENLGAEKIVLGGISMGATTVLLSCAHGLPDCVVGITADSGYSSPEEIIKLVAKKFMKLNASFFIPFLNLLCRLFGNFSIYNANVLDAIKNTDIPILFIHGKNDGLVPYEMSVTAYNSINERGRIVLVDGADHGLSYLIDKNKVSGEMKSFLSNL
ncbi:MAG: alpha/beta hydrolase [Clostridia bacterium]|nr:alpha/beta hydrolase [Clostridia bacterium]